MRAQQGMRSTDPTLIVEKHYGSILKFSVTFSRVGVTLTATTDFQNRF